MVKWWVGQHKVFHLLQVSKKVVILKSIGMIVIKSSETRFSSGRFNSYFNPLTTIWIIGIKMPTRISAGVGDCPFLLLWSLLIIKFQTFPHTCLLTFFGYNCDIGKLTLKCRFKRKNDHKHYFRGCHTH